MITSKQNPFLKEIRSLSDKKYRDKLGLYLVEGTKIVNEAIELKLPVRAVIGTERGLALVKDTDCRRECVSEEVFNSISSEISPQGVIAVVEKPTNAIIAPKGCCLLLDGVADPANVGAIIRTAAASGYNYVYTTEECADPYSPKAVRSSMSGVFRVNVIRGKICDLLSVIDKPLYVADMCGENAFNHIPKSEFCLCIGNEGHGVSSELKARASVTVSIPMQNGVESLNAAVSAALLMYGLKGSITNFN